MKHLLISIFTVLSLSVITIAIIAYGRGFRYSPQDGEVAATGLLNATSDPDGAQVYVDGILKTATDSTLNLLPGTYKVKINKEGYLPWEKEMTIFKEVVAQTETFLFPANPGLSPLTTSGVTNPTVSPDGTSIAFIRRGNEATQSGALAESPTSELQPLPRTGAERLVRDPTSTFGIFVLDLEDRPLSFSRKLRMIASGDQIPNFKFSARGGSALGGQISISLIWSPDAKQVLAVFQPEEESELPSTAYLLDASRSNPRPQPVVSSAEILQLWKEQREIEARSKIESLPNKLKPLFANIDTTSGVSPASPAGGRSGSPDVESQSPSVKRSAEIISFSPDESKILYRATQKTTIPQIIKPPLIGVNPTEEHRTIEPDNIYVYDLKEDRNYFVGKAESFKAEETKSGHLPVKTFDFSFLTFNLNWFPTSRHLYFVDEGPSADSADSGQAKIKVMEYDVTNETTVYAGPFEPDLVIPWPNGSKFVILTTLNPDASETLNLYAVKLR